MGRQVREMALAEFDLVTDYFHGASEDYLYRLGVDPAKLPAVDDWREKYALELAKPLVERTYFVLVWLLDDKPLGFSSLDTITVGETAFMHLHVFKAGNRAKGHGVEFVRQSAKVYVEQFDLQRLYCQPNAFNTAPHRTLQKAGFRFHETLDIVPGWINYRQPVTRWVVSAETARTW